jgi:putative two-component system response regulator
MDRIEPKFTILVVDDLPDNLLMISSLLNGEYKVKIANRGEKALSIAASNSPPDLILLDVMMPGMDGYEVCRRLKRDPRTMHIPVIFLTAKTDIEDEQRGLELGAVDYITKPIRPHLVMARIKNHLMLKVMNDFLHNKNEFLEQEVHKRTEEVTAIQDVTIFVLASLAETRDSDTGHHIRRTQYYVKSLAEKLRNHPRFAWFLTENNIKILFKSAPLHDIGKVGIPDRILLKQGSLEPDEFEIMKTHSELGYHAIAQAETALGMCVQFLSMAKAIARSHHEKWNGSGYPQGLAGEAIPISARLMAIADVYDALISRRIYKENMAHKKAVEIMKLGRGSHFDADMLDAFLDIQEEFLAIALRFADSVADIEKNNNATL